MAVFLRADKDAEVQRDDLLQIINLQTFRRFDRVGTAMFAQVVEDSEEGAFWIASRTRGLFTVPLTVLLTGRQEQLWADLASIRQLEQSMYRPVGTYDSSLYVSPLEGGDASKWHAAALETAVVPTIGFRLQALPESEFRGTNGDMDYYVQGDVGTVSRWTDDRISITWDRTGLTSSIGKLAWVRYFGIVAEGPEVPAVGSQLQALPGQQFHIQGKDGETIVFELHDIGIVTNCANGRIAISWDRSGLSSTVPCSAWAGKFRLLPPKVTPVEAEP